jgi:glycosyltransferase involved in cell wall biosynthesis
MNRRVLISSNTAWSIHNFRSGLIRTMIDQGYHVTAVAPDDDYSQRVRALGCDFVSLPMDNHGTNPVRDLRLLGRYVSLLQAVRPAVYLGYTVKPNVYGSMAAHLLGIPAINNIAGLGTAFVDDNLVTRIVRGLYKCALHRSRHIFFQNADDRELFIRARLVPAERTERLPGSGIDLSRYRPDPPAAARPSPRPFRFLLLARLLKYKGVMEYAEAARMVRRQCADTEFQLLGFLDEENPNAVSSETIKGWEEEGLIRYLGETDDVLPFLADADCIVLPSYREGVPRTLLEAAAMARPIVATDATGCRDVVDDGVNGFLCPVRDAAGLAEKLMRMLRLPAERRLEMGWAGRRKVESEFDERIVIQKYLDAVKDIADAPAGGPARDAGKAVAHWH